MPLQRNVRLIMSITSPREPPSIAVSPMSQPDHRAAKFAPRVRHLLPLPIGIVAESRRDPLGFLTRNNRRFGDVFRYPPGPFTFHLIAHPDGVKHVLQDNHKNYPR